MPQAPDPPGGSSSHMVAVLHLALSPARKWPGPTCTRRSRHRRSHPSAPCTNGRCGSAASIENTTRRSRCGAAHRIPGRFVVGPSVGPTVNTTRTIRSQHADCRVCRTVGSLADGRAGRLADGTSCTVWNRPAGRDDRIRRIAANTARIDRSQPPAPDCGRTPGRTAWRRAPACRRAQRQHISRPMVPTDAPHPAQLRCRFPTTATAFGPVDYNGIDRPRAFAVSFVSVGTGRDGVAGCSGGVVSTSNRSLGVHSSAVHNAISVARSIWLGSLVNSADISNPDISASRRRSSAPVHTSRWPQPSAAANGSSRRTVLSAQLRQRRCDRSAIGVLDERRRWAHIPHRRTHRPMAQKLLNDNQIHSSLVVVGCTRAPQGMRAESLGHRAALKLHQIP